MWTEFVVNQSKVFQAIATFNLFLWSIRIERLDYFNDERKSLTGQFIKYIELLHEKNALRFENDWFAR